MIAEPDIRLRFFYRAWRTLPLIALLIFTTPAEAKPYGNVAQASDVGTFTANASLSRKVKHPAAMKVLIASTGTKPMQLDYNVSCETADDFDYQSGGAVVNDGQAFKLPRIFRRPRSCDVSVGLSYEDFESENPPLVTITETLQARQFKAR